MLVVPAGALAAAAAVAVLSATVPAWASFTMLAMSAAEKPRFPAPAAWMVMFAPAMFICWPLPRLTTNPPLPGPPAISEPRPRLEALAASSSMALVSAAASFWIVWARALRVACVAVWSARPVRAVLIWVRASWMVFSDPWAPVIELRLLFSMVADCFSTFCWLVRFVAVKNTAGLSE